MDWAELGRTIQPWASLLGILLTTFAVFIAARSLRLTLRTNRAKFAFDLTESFLKEDKIKSFWARLNYDVGPDAWVFDLSKFRHSEDEKYIDTILYKFMPIGHMIRSRVIVARDVNSLYFMCRQVFHNLQVREYLRFVQIDTFMADGLVGLHFEDALYCYEQMTLWAVKTGYAGKAELNDCRTFIAELRTLHQDPELRQTISKRIGYAPRSAIMQISEEDRK